MPHETCIVTVKAINGGLFQFPVDTEPVSAVYAISLTKPLREPAKLEMQHCMKLGGAESSKFMSFAVASQDRSSISYKFELVPGGIFKEDSYLGSIDRQQFSFFSIVWHLLGFTGKSSIIIATTENACCFCVSQKQRTVNSIEH